MTQTPLKIALVVPAHNEEKFIEKSVTSLEEYLSTSDDLKKKYKASILIAEDGSTDNTLNIISNLSNKYDNIIIRHNPTKLGRGRAVKEAWRNIDADIYAYLDADLATPLSYLDILLDKCNNNDDGNNGFDVVTGSRYIEHSDVKRPFLRNRVSKSYNYLINLIFGTSVKDHQCGFKAVTKNACNIICKKSIFDDWFWDTEIFVIARRNGLSVCEFPIKWQEKRGTKTPLKRLLKDISIHSLGIIKLLLNNNNQLKTVNSRGQKENKVGEKKNSNEP
jgi:glycosyltransferase involved in cell wall biosynthesis